jgi:malonyl CoA-acyl carrier protein transacylase
VLSSSLVSQAGIFVTSVARLLALGERGLDLDALSARCTAATGHSQGVMAALLFAEGRGPERLVARTAEIACYFFWQGYRMQESFVLATVPPAVRAAAEQAGVGEPSPMAALAGLTSELLSEALARFHAANPQLPPIDVALDNGYARKVLSARPRRSWPSPARSAPSATPRSRPSPGAGSAAAPSISDGSSSPPRRRSTRATWTPAAAPCPRPRPRGHRVRAGPAPPARAGQRRHRPAHRRGRGGLLEMLVRIQHVEPVQWGAVCAALRASHPQGVTHVLDFGPGDAVAKLTALNCRGFGVHVLPLATEAGAREALGPAAEVPRGLDYRTVRPPPGARRRRRGRARQRLAPLHRPPARVPARA